MTYAIVGDERAMEFFSVWEDSGVVTLKQSIADVTDLIFNVSTVSCVFLKRLSKILFSTVVAFLDCG